MAKLWGPGDERHVKQSRVTHKACSAAGRMCPPSYFNTVLIPPRQPDLTSEMFQFSSFPCGLTVSWVFLTLPKMMERITPGLSKLKDHCKVQCGHKGSRVREVRKELVWSNTGSAIVGDPQVLWSLPSLGPQLPWEALIWASAELDDTRSFLSIPNFST